MRPVLFGFVVVFLLFDFSPSGRLSSPALFAKESSLSVPAEEEALFEKALSYKEQEDRERAVATLEEFIQTYPFSVLLPDVYFQLGHLYTNPESKKQLQLFKEFLGKFQDDYRVSEVRLQLSDLYITQGAIPEALALWSHLPGEEALKAEVYDKASQAYYDQKEYYKALEVLVQEQKVTSGAEGLAAIRKAMETLIREKLSEHDLEWVVKNFGSHFPVDEAVIRLITLYSEKGDTYREEREAKRFLTLFPDHPRAVMAKNAIGQIQNKVKAHRVLVAVALPLSGNLSPFGNVALNGVQLALQQFKEAHPNFSVGVVVKDLGDGTPAGEIGRWIEEYRPVAMVGPLLSREVNQIAPFLERLGLLSITPGATAPKLVSQGISVVRNALTARAQCTALAEYAVVQEEILSYAILYPKNNYGAEWVACFSEEIVKRGGEVIHAEPYAVNETDFSQAIRRLKGVDLKKKGKMKPVEEAGREGQMTYVPGFEALLLPGEASKVGLMIPQLAFHEIRDVLLLGGSGWNTPELLKVAGSYAEGAVFVDGFFLDSPDPMVRQFVGQYRRRYQDNPDILAAQAYDAARLILSAIEAGSTTPSEIKSAVLRTKRTPGVSGFVHEVKDGEFKKDLFLLTVKKGKVTALR